MGNRGASAIPFRESDPVPRALDHGGIRDILNAFAQAAHRALTAGFRVLELHCAHGYLAHEFLSPLANKRTDEYGGSCKNRIRFVLELTEAVRAVWPERFPLFVRISATDWKEGGWTLDDSVVLASELRPRNVDLIDCSSGAMVPDARIPAAPGFQVPFAERIKREANIQTGAVGMITDPHQADEIIRSGKADMVLLAREFLRDPYWPLHAAKALGQDPQPPVQYQRAFPVTAPPSQKT